jgi:hypothetical protein
MNKQLTLEQYQAFKSKLSFWKSTKQHTPILDLYEALLSHKNEYLGCHHHRSLIEKIREYIFESLITLEYIRSGEDIED